MGKEMTRAGTGRRMLTYADKMGRVGDGGPGVPRASGAVRRQMMGVRLGCFFLGS